MKAKYFNEKQSINMKDIEEVARGLANGKTAVFPTETVYGIGTNAMNAEACEKVFEVKGRPANKPLIVLISNINMLDGIVDELNEIEEKLMQKFWPGALTIILKKNKKCNIPNVVTAGRDNIGVRMTSGKIAGLLIDKAGVPIVAPSANISGNPTGIKIENIIEELGDRVDYILDYGDVEKSTESTIVKVENNKILILRQGKISKEELSKIAEIQE